MQYSKHQSDQTDFDPSFEEELLAKFLSEKQSKEHRATKRRLSCATGVAGSSDAGLSTNRDFYAEENHHRHLPIEFAAGSQKKSTTHYGSNDRRKGDNSRRMSTKTTGSSSGSGADVLTHADGAEDTHRDGGKGKRRRATLLATEDVTATPEQQELSPGGGTQLILTAPESGSSASDSSSHPGEVENFTGGSEGGFLVTQGEDDDEECEEEEEDKMAEVGVQVTPRISAQTMAEYRPKFVSGQNVPTPKVGGEILNPRGAVMKVGPYLLPAVRSDNNPHNPFATKAQLREREKDVARFIESEKKNILPFVRDSWETSGLKRAEIRAHYRREGHRPAENELTLSTHFRIQKGKLNGSSRGKKKKKALGEDESLKVSPRELLALRQQQREDEERQAEDEDAKVGSRRPSSTHSSGNHSARQQQFDEDIDWSGTPQHYNKKKKSTQKKSSAGVRASTVPLLPPQHHHEGGKAHHGSVVPLSSNMLVSTGPKAECDTLLDLPTIHHHSTTPDRHHHSLSRDVVKEQEKATLKLYYQAQQLFKEYGGVPNGPPELERRRKRLRQQQDEHKKSSNTAVKKKIPLQEILSMEKELQSNLDFRREQRIRKLTGLEKSLNEEERLLGKREEDMQPTTGDPSDGKRQQPFVSARTLNSSNGGPPKATPLDGSGLVPQQSSLSLYDQGRTPRSGRAGGDTTTSSAKEVSLAIVAKKEAHLSRVQSQNGPTSSQMIHTVLSRNRKGTVRNLERLKSSSEFQLNPVPIKGDYSGIDVVASTTSPPGSPLGAGKRREVRQSPSRKTTSLNGKGRNHPLSPVK